jgi:hypothetical protein
MKNILMTCIAGIALLACTPSPSDTATPGPDTSASTVPETNPAPAPPVVGADPAVTDTCGMAQYAALIGKPATDAGVPPAGPQVRHLPPGSQVTMDFSPTRLNIDIDAAGVITALRCG